LFVTARSGSPFTYGFVNYTPQNDPQQVGLAYIPAKGETINFFAATPTQTAQQQANAFDKFIDGNPYLSSRRGRFTNVTRPEHHGITTQTFISPRINFNTDKEASKLHTLTISLDVTNLTNLIDKNRGKVYFSPNTYNSTSSVGPVPYIPAKSSQGYPLYQFINPGSPYSVDTFASRWQMQIGARYTF
jgi:hypothetical protein